MFSQNIFAERFKSLRKEKGFSQQALATKLGVTKTFVSDIERCRRTTTIEKLVEISYLFDVSIDYLVGKDDIPKRN